MSKIDIDKKKQVIGLFGEMQLAMNLHERGWQVHRAYIDEGIDFIITKYWCPCCNLYSNQLLRYDDYKGASVKCVTNLCEHCQETELNVISKYLQVKTSEGIPTNDSSIRDFSFHPKIRYDMGHNVFYIWIAVFENDNEDTQSKICHFYVFNTKDVDRFDNTSLPTYQITDNQKTTLRINKNGKVLNQGVKYDYSCFNEDFYNNFEKIEQ
ncbi:MAG: hypothetical protein FWG98_05585 [Candidatus Cloacimonetes bacterium]|nr:hypothetical protein [Candidatus Cloacimonadota bacterium]